uniref:Uncharacterized protein n=1 Tax=Plectus sambesii TaxID=2011161 RepID=A0A914X7E2_9BILA
MSEERLLEPTPPVDLSCPETMMSESPEENEKKARSGEISSTGSDRRIPPTSDSPLGDVFRGLPGLRLPLPSPANKVPLHKPTATSAAVQPPKVISLPPGYNLNRPAQTLLHQTHLNQPLGFPDVSKSFSFQVRTASSVTVGKPSFKPYSAFTSMPIPSMPSTLQQHPSLLRVPQHFPNLGRSALNPLSSVASSAQISLPPTLNRPLHSQPTAIVPPVPTKAHSMPSNLTTSLPNLVQPPTFMGVPPGKGAVPPGARSPLIHSATSPSSQASPAAAAGGQSNNQQTTPGPSPRPSILRKFRDAGVTSAARRLPLDGNRPASASNGNTPQRNASTPLRNESPAEGIEETASNHSTVSSSSTVSGADHYPAESPRKRPRKQQFERLSADMAGVERIKIEDDDELLPQRPVIPLWQVAPPGAADRPKSPAQYSNISNGTVKDESLLSDNEDENDDVTIEDLGDRDSLTPPIRTVSSFEKTPSFSERFPERQESDSGPLYRPRPKLTTGYLLTWQPRRNHFKRSDMIREKPPRRVPSAQGHASSSQSQLASQQPSTASSTSSTNGELSNFGMTSSSSTGVARETNNTQQKVVQRLASDRATAERMSPWKLQRMEQQLNTLEESEMDNWLKMDNWIKDMDTFVFSCQSDLGGKDATLVREMALTMARRHSALRTMASEGRSALRAVTRHAVRVDKYLKRYANRRTMRAAKKDQLNQHQQQRISVGSSAVGTLSTIGE